MNFTIKLSVLALALPLVSFGQDNLDAPLHQTTHITILHPEKMHAPLEIKRKAEHRKQQMKQLGYVEQNPISPSLRKLLAMQHNRYPFPKKSHLLHLHAYGNEISEVHIQKNISAIPLAFSFKGIPANSNTKVMAYVPAGITVNGQWTGVGSYFNYKNLGTCHYLIDHVALSQANIQLRSDGIRRDVNKKPTNFIIEGNKKQGFLYSISWYDNHFFHDLECANTHFNKKLHARLIGLAQRLDRQVQ